MAHTPRSPRPKAAAKVTRGQILAKAEEAARDAAPQGSPLDSAFAAFSQFDGPDGDKDPEAIASAQQRVRDLLRQGLL